MKIESKSLMLGDWVKSRTGMNVKIVGIDHDYPSVYEPIPLTEENLEKNGGKNNYIQPNDDLDIEYRYSAEGGVFIRVTEIGDEMTPSRTIFAKELDYVHQYQHLLRLCGLTKLADHFNL